MVFGIKRFVLFFSLVLLFSVTFFQLDAFARAGGGRSMGFRGSHSYSSPGRSFSYSQSRTSTPYSRPYASPYSQSNRGAFLPGLMGGLAGGLLGGMFFRGMGFGGGYGGGGGMGLIDILILAGIGYFIYKKFFQRSSNNFSAYSSSRDDNPSVPVSFSQDTPMYDMQDDLVSGLAAITRSDMSFEERRFGDLVMDIFFKIQGAWMNRNLATVSSLLTDEMARLLQSDVDKLLSEKKINRLENIAVRKVEIVEAWQEVGQDYVTAQIYANLLDYTTDEMGNVIAGSKTDPVKFEEYWTFVRPTGNNPWRLSGIDQK